MDDIEAENNPTNLFLCVPSEGTYEFFLRCFQRIETREDNSESLQLSMASVSCQGSALRTRNSNLGDYLP